MTAGIPASTLTMTAGCQLSQQAIQLFPWEISAAFQGNTVSPNLRQGWDQSNAQKHQPFILWQATFLAVKTHAEKTFHLFLHFTLFQYKGRYRIIIFP